MSKAILKHVFPGGNTCQGFYSFYHHMISPDATRIFVIKGGPGVGKSTFMRAIGQAMLDKGFDVEFHCCSSDNGSLDGVVIPALKIALVDGTAPHIVDPKNPGAVDEIIHLGDFWNEPKMRANKEAILQSNTRVGRLFQIAYCSLREAKAIIDEWETYITEAQNFARVNELTVNILKDIGGQITPQFAAAPKSRRLFASAITPKGPETHWPTILQGVTRLYSIQGLPGSGKSTLIGKVAQLAETLGLFTEIYHRPLDPNKLDGVVIPALQLAVVNTGLPFNFNPSQIAGLSVVANVDLSAFLDQAVLQKYATEIAGATERFRAAFNRGSEYIRQAKAEHDVMETYYVPAMDFGAINKKREETLQRILKYAEEMK
ncbi:MAG: PRK06851 family protein [Clostridia bacterium]|nr:PRK06851 family protein [Clostridia bacterium]